MKYLKYIILYAYTVTFFAYTMEERYALIVDAAIPTAFPVNSVNHDEAESLINSFVDNSYPRIFSPQDTIALPINNQILPIINQNEMVNIQKKYAQKKRINKIKNKKQKTRKAQQPVHDNFTAHEKIALHFDHKKPNTFCSIPKAIISCTTCNQTLETHGIRDCIRRHYEENHPQDSNKETKYNSISNEMTCMSCNKQFKQLQLFKKHHIDKQHTTCAYCNINFNNINLSPQKKCSIDNHLSMNNDHTCPQLSSPNVTCTLCQETAGSLGPLDWIKRHYKTKHPDIDYKQALKRKDYTITGRFSCNNYEQCTYTSGVLRSFKNHVQRKHSQCPLCHVEFEY